MISNLRASLIVLLLSLTLSQSLQASIIVRTEPLTDGIGILNLDLGLELNQHSVLGLDYSHGIAWAKIHNSTRIYGQYFLNSTHEDGAYGKLYYGRSNFSPFPTHSLFTDHVEMVGALAGYQWATDSGLLWNLGAGAQRATDRWGKVVWLPAWELSLGFRL